jgi:hypothetical protein
MSDILEVVDTVSDATVTTTAAVDAGYEEFLDDVERCRQAELDAEMDEMYRVAAADGVEHGPLFHDLTPARHAELMAMFPTGRGWIPVIGYAADADRPFTSELRRGTPNGPDVVRLANYSTAELALRAAVMFAINMVLIDLGHGDDQARETVRSMIEYAAR